MGWCLRVLDAEAHGKGLGLYCNSASCQLLVEGPCRVSYGQDDLTGGARLRGFGRRP